MARRIQARVRRAACSGQGSVAQRGDHGLQQAGWPHPRRAGSGMELLRRAAQGLPRHAGRILKTAMQMAVPKGLNHLPDDLLQQAIEALR